MPVIVHPGTHVQSVLDSVLPGETVQLVGTHRLTAPLRPNDHTVLAGPAVLLPGDPTRRLDFIDVGERRDVTIRNLTIRGGVQLAPGNLPHALQRGVVVDINAASTGDTEYITVERCHFENLHAGVSAVRLEASDIHHFVVRECAFRNIFMRAELDQGYGITSNMDDGLVIGNRFERIENVAYRFTGRLSQKRASRRCVGRANTIVDCVFGANLHSDDPSLPVEDCAIIGDIIDCLWGSEPTMAPIRAAGVRIEDACGTTIRGLTIRVRRPDSVTTNAFSGIRITGTRIDHTVVQGCSVIVTDGVGLWIERFGSGGVGLTRGIVVSGNTVRATETTPLTADGGILVRGNVKGDLLGNSADAPVDAIDVPVTWFRIGNTPAP